MSTISFILGVPAFKGQVSSWLLDMTMHLTTLSLMSQAAEDPRSRDPRLVGAPTSFRLLARAGLDTCSIAKSRNKLLWNAVAQPAADWLLMVDADTHVKDTRGALAALRMLAEGDARRAAVIAAPVLARTGVYNFIEGPQSLLPPSRALLANHVFDVERIGTAFMAINLKWIRENWADGHLPADVGWMREWLAEHPDADVGGPLPSRRWFAFRDIDAPGGAPEELGEDYSFCDGIRARRGQIIADWRFEPHHEGAPYPDARIVPITKIDEQASV